MGKAKICMSGVQDIVEGVTPPRCEYMNGFAACPDVKDTYCARVHDIFPPQVSQVFLGLLKTFFAQGNSGVSSGVVYIESGLKVAFKDKTIYRNSLNVPPI